MTGSNVSLTDIPFVDIGAESPAVLAQRDPNAVDTFRWACLGVGGAQRFADAAARRWLARTVNPCRDEFAKLALRAKAGAVSPAGE